MILLIDNRDSFTFNIAQFLMELGETVEVVRAHHLDAEVVMRMQPAGVITGPGPGHPSDAALSIELTRALPPTIPLLGVCLGHQAIALALDAKIARCQTPWHGRSSALTSDQQGLFEGVPQGVSVGRYHSLTVDPDAIPGELIVQATTPDGEIQAIRHVSRPVFGVQFHPESILSECGHRLLWNFVRVTQVLGGAAIRERVFKDPSVQRV